jgi:hypothetical protein
LSRAEKSIEREIEVDGQSFDRDLEQATTSA